eukprot:COSAG02_NODE_4086_length_5806_cov_8.073243_2_plen_157_part_00
MQSVLCRVGAAQCVPDSPVEEHSVPSLDLYRDRIGSSRCSSSGLGKRRAPICIKQIMLVRAWNHLESSALRCGIGQKVANLLQANKLPSAPQPMQRAGHFLPQRTRGGPTLMLTRGRGVPSRSLFSRPESWCQPPVAASGVRSATGCAGGVYIMCE